MVVLGSDFQRLQMKPVEGALNSACGFVIDTQAFSADVVVVLEGFEQVVQAVVFPGYGKTGTQEVPVAVDVFHIDRRLTKPRLSPVMGNSGQSGTMGTGRKCVPSVMVAQEFPSTRRRAYRPDAQLFVAVIMFELPARLIIGRQNNAFHAVIAVTEDQLVIGQLAIRA
ncbi:hypothetical protein [Pseudomonas viridiflava]|uniref:hypothetical protein n=1 Tax=Pseudomonas viridiflava TaxID=33069 RepID=UPI0013CE5573|nr:hypothetical protein [Pseudomonas viridiflava]